MLPFSVPPGTTPSQLLKEVWPAEHARVVPASAARGTTWRVRIDLQGERGEPGLLVDYTISGPSLQVEEPRGKVDVYVRAEQRVAAWFIEDWTTTGDFLPAPAQGDLGLLTDPRVLERLVMIDAVAEVALSDFELGRASLKVACGRSASHFDPYDDPQVTVDATMDTLRRLLSGELSPVDAIADEHVSLKGKLRVAMQFALALAPLLPSPSSGTFATSRARGSKAPR